MPPYSPLSPEHSDTWKTTSTPNPSGKNNGTTPLIDTEEGLKSPLLGTPAPTAVKPIQTPNAEKGTKKVSTRVDCLDTFRGFCLCLMIFVNYGGTFLIGIIPLLSP